MERNKGLVYIFENSSINRIKVGMTSVSIKSRIKPLNFNVTCQVCGIRLLNSKGNIPFHKFEDENCIGGGELPIERDISLALKYLEDLKIQQINSKGVLKSSITRKLNSLKKRINFYQNSIIDKNVWKLGYAYWKFKYAYLTTNFALVEELSHKYLCKYLDKESPVGELFKCSLSKSVEAVEDALEDLKINENTLKINGWEELHKLGLE